MTIQTSLTFFFLKHGAPFPRWPRNHNLYWISCSWSHHTSVHRRPTTHDSYYNTWSHCDVITRAEAYDRVFKYKSSHWSRKCSHVLIMWYRNVSCWSAPLKIILNWYLTFFFFQSWREQHIDHLKLPPDCQGILQKSRFLDFYFPLHVKYSCVCCIKTFCPTSESCFLFLNLRTLA